MPSTKYSLLPQQGHSDDAAPELELEVGKERSSADRDDGLQGTAQPPGTTSFRACVFLLLISLLVNVAQFAWPHPNPVSSAYADSSVADGSQTIPGAGQDCAPSHFMNLTQGVEVPFASQTSFLVDHSVDPSDFDAVWESAEFEPNRNLVAVDYAWAAERGLPKSQQWPWDANKGIYAVRSMHLLHCLKAFHLTFSQVRNDEPIFWAWTHLEHCLHVLREEIECKADDSLVYTGRVNGQEDRPLPVAGLGQARVCRNWTQLVDWVTDRSACYKNIPSHGDDWHEWERYKFCPDGRTYW